MIPTAIPLKSEALFRLAMTHTSAAHDTVAESYERLEFFGDSVLGLVIAQYLYENHPTWDQGMLSKAKSSVVQEAPLAQVALRLGLDKCLVISAGEEATGGRKRPSILADVMEAVIGGIYTRNTGRNLDQVPFFGDIPILGVLFQRRRASDTRNELIIFLTPRIVNRAEALGR